MAWQHFSELLVWQKAMDLTDEIYRVTKLLPREEIYGLAGQMRRAAVSIPSNIAEGQGRMSDRECRQFFSVAQGSNAELETQLLICIRQNYLTQEDADPALSLCRELGKMLTAFLLRLKTKD